MVQIRFCHNVIYIALRDITSKEIYDISFRDVTALVSIKPVIKDACVVSKYEFLGTCSTPTFVFTCQS
jgi:hypothetical protein